MRTGLIKGENEVNLRERSIFNKNIINKTYFECSSPTEPCSCSLLSFNLSTSNLLCISSSCHVLFLWWALCLLSASPPIASRTSASVPFTTLLGIRIWSNSFTVMILLCGGGCNPPTSPPPPMKCSWGTSYDVVSSLSERTLDVRLLAERLRVNGLWLFSLFCVKIPVYRNKVMIN